MIWPIRIPPMPSAILFGFFLGITLRCFGAKFHLGMIYWSGDRQSKMLLPSRLLMYFRILLILSIIYSDRSTQQRARGSVHCNNIVRFLRHLYFDSFVLPFKMTRQFPHPGKWVEPLVLSYDLGT